MKKALLFVVGVVFVVNVYAQKEGLLDCDVRQVSNKLSVNGNQLFYALPRNTLRIQLEVTCETLFKGPYSQYASKYLGISDGVIHNDDELFKISSVKVDRLSQPDSMHYYSVTVGGFSGFPMLQLNSDGVILGCNLPYQVEGNGFKPSSQFQSEFESDEYVFTDLGVKPFVYEKTETLYKMVETDSVPARIAYEHKKIEQTSEEMNAEEAAAFIIKLRKRRLKLIAGIKDEVIDVNGNAIDAMIEELKRIEDKYLELFIGKTSEKKYTYYFDFDPDAGTSAEQQIVGWFSNKKGLIVGKREFRKADYKPLVIHANVKGKIPETQIQVMDQNQKTPTPIKYGLYYRIPGRIDVMLKYNNQILTQQEWEIAQKGQVLPLPVTYLNDQSYAVEFYPEVGSVKRIFKVK